MAIGRMWRRRPRRGGEERRDHPRAARALRWHAFENRLAEGSITEAVIRLANGEEVTVAEGTPVLLAPGDSIVWRECHGWGWTSRAIES